MKRVELRQPLHEKIPLCHMAERFSSYSGVNCHVIHKCVEANIILFLRNHSTSEKSIQDAFLLQEKMLLLFLLRKALPFICYRKVEIHYNSLP